MLSLRSSNTSSSTKFRKKKFSSVKSGPVVWIDFTDRRTVYSDDSGTLANTGDTIQFVDNKAFDKRFGRSSTVCIGSGLKQQTSSRRPAFVTGVYGLTAARFDGANDQLLGDKAVAAVATNRLSTSRLDGQDITVFWVAKNDSTTPGQENVLVFGSHDVTDGSSDPIQIGVQNNDYRIFMGDASDKSGDVNMNTNRQATTNVELWTVKFAGSSNAYMYANGDTSDGITNGTTKDHGYPLDVNNLDCSINIGAGTWDGDIYELLVYNTALPDKEIKEIERKLKQKYKIT